MQRKIIAILFIFLILGSNQAKENTSKNKCLKYNKGKIFDCIKKQLAMAFQYQSISSFAAFIAIKIGIWLAGFSSLGPVAGSIAAWFQSLLGNVVANSLFSFFQAVAMGKTALLIIPSLAIGTIIGIIYLVLNCFSSDSCDLEEKQRQKRSNQKDNQEKKNQKKQKESFWSSSWDIIKQIAQDQVEIVSELIPSMPKQITDLKKNIQSQLTKIFPNFSNQFAEFAGDALKFSDYLTNIISDQLQIAQENMKIVYESIAQKIDESIVGLSDLVEFIWENRLILQESFEYTFQVLKEQYYYFQTLSKKIDGMKQSIKKDACMNSFLEYLDGIENS
ncbi:unnamed protein product [Paramecium sonneborni]|uniref:Transmembrane protein n=1 Tax=Paramecium sonneborni TaxID=65129 RepID=A0A8S1QD44_9CILI|nr:unnamed protein product [Paramecium sonneborni]